MKGSHTMLLLGLGSLALLLYAYSKRPGAAVRPTPGGAATAGTTGAAPVGTKPAKGDPLKVIGETVKQEATKAGQQAIQNWFDGLLNAP